MRRPMSVSVNAELLTHRAKSSAPNLIDRFALILSWHRVRKVRIHRIHELKTCFFQDTARPKIDRHRFSPNAIEPPLTEGCFDQGLSTFRCEALTPCPTRQAITELCGMQSFVDTFVKDAKPANKPPCCSFMCDENFGFGSTGCQKIAVCQTLFRHRAPTVEVKHHFWIRF